MTSSPIRLAVLDMAGTTVDDRNEVYRVLREAVEREGAVIDVPTFQQWMGTEKRSAIGHLLALGGVEADDALVDSAFAWFLAELRRTYTAQPPVPLPGIADALATLRTDGVKVALTTGFSRDITTLLLKGMGWTVGADPTSSTVDAVVCGDEVPEGRPAPFMIQRVMEQTGVTDPAQVISVGDTAVDVESARRAGVRAIGVLTGSLTRAEHEAAGADVVLEGAQELPAHLGLPGAEVR